MNPATATPSAERELLEKVAGMVSAHLDGDCIQPTEDDWRDALRRMDAVLAAGAGAATPPAMGKVLHDAVIAMPVPDAEPNDTLGRAWIAGQKFGRMRAAEMLLTHPALAECSARDSRAARVSSTAHRTPDDRT